MGQSSGSFDEEQDTKRAGRKGRRQRNRMRSWPEDRRRRSSAGSGRRRVKGWGKAPEASMRSRIRSVRDGKVGGRETECVPGQKIAGAGRVRAQEGEGLKDGAKL